ncbi:MAG TPA: DUF4384 domain-containing protein [Gemmatimonadales bacterium]|nr:DUF4384 domain-containing protein [Gemmatimonadales bacterium]
MITALLLPLLAFGAPGPNAVRNAGGDDPAIQVWISNDRRFLPGDRAKVQVRTREDGYLLVLQADPAGHLRVLFPLDPTDDNFVRGGRKYEIRGRGGRESFTVDNERGTGSVYAAVSHDPFKFDQFVLGDHWDYRNLAPQRLSSNPEQDFNELVRRMVDNSFDYDILTYDVLERVVYASDYYPDTYAGGYYYGGYGGCAYSYFCGRPYYGSPYSVSIGLFFGRPYYRPYFFDPFYAGYNPYFDPFFFDPYYYRPFYYRPYYYPAYYPYPYGGYYYNHYRFNNRYYYANQYYGGWNRPYTPYRFRLTDGSVGPYRDRRYTFGRAVNTVYMPPVLRDRQPANATPARRVTDTRPSGDDRPTVDGRTRAPSDANNARRGGDRTPVRAPESNGGRRVENRLGQPNIDARRARQPDEARSIIPDSRDRTDRPNMPQEIRPSRPDNTPRRAVDRPEPAAAGAGRTAPQIDARRSRPDDGSMGRDGPEGGLARPDNRPDPQPEARRYDPGASGVYRPESRGPESRASEPRSVDRGGDRGGDRGSDRGSYSPPPRSAPSDGGGMRGGSGSGGSGGGGGGFRRR